MATLYSHTAGANYTSSSGGAGYTMALSFTAIASGVPNQLKINVQTASSQDIYIKSDKTIGSTTYASALNVSLSAGVNTVNLTGVASITSGTTYWVYTKTTATNPLALNSLWDAATSTEAIWRSLNANIDPNQLYAAKNSGIEVFGGAAETGKAFLLF